MDSVDRQILDLLQQNGRATVLEIAKRVKLSSPAVSERLKRLHKRGYVKRYVALLDEKKLGKQTTAFVHVSIQHPRYFPGFISRVTEIPEVLECYRITGNHSCLLKARVKDSEALELLLNQKIGEIEGVINATSEIVLSTIKEETKLDLRVE
ncbi:MAG: AsnC family transcriptional regulator [Proteobacteria bacterium]|nr:AsnC family transcriptional regulator [Pseudomonadota bacterium]NIS71337.1 AsnC family transcriptional regulator [Pseudomonadota bacterium]